VGNFPKEQFSEGVRFPRDIFAKGSISWKVVKNIENAFFGEN